MTRCRRATGFCDRHSRLLSLPVAFRSLVSWWWTSSTASGSHHRSISLPQGPWQSGSPHGLGSCRHTYSPARLPHCLRRPGSLVIGRSFPPKNSPSKPSGSGGRTSGPGSIFYPRLKAEGAGEGQAGLCGQPMVMRRRRGRFFPFFLNSRPQRPRANTPLPCGAEYFPLRVALCMGRGGKAADKEKDMADFSLGNLDDFSPPP